MSDGNDLVDHLRRISLRRSPFKPAPILGLIGTSRHDGNTQRLAQLVFGNMPGANLVDISQLTIGPYDYSQAYDDDFPLIADAIDKAQTLVFASPVYWYSMSAQMKILFDRLTDLTEMYKDIGKRLAGKHGFLIATGETDMPPASFEPPFEETIDYFDMKWGGMLYQTVGASGKTEHAIEDQARTFAAKIRDSVSNS